MTLYGVFVCFFFFFKQKTAYEITTGDWSSDVCSSDLTTHATITNTLVELSGIGIHCTRGTSSVISDCTLWRNSSNMYLTSLGGASSDKALAVIEKCTFGQGSDGLYMVADGTNISQAFISDTLFDTNTNPLTVASGQAYTYGNNRFLNNS